MGTQDLDNGSMDTVETSTTSLISTVLALPVAQDKTDGERHEPCSTRHLLTERFRFDGQVLTSLDAISGVDTISGLRFGAAAACHNCKIVLDAVITYSSGRLSTENIERIKVMAGEQPITITYRPVLDTGEESNEVRFRDIKLELFQLEGKP